MNKVVVLDTNVLLADPNSVLSFPRAEVVIPETVLGELDKLKTARVDPDLRFRGREVSRILFDLSEEGSLVEGVALPDGGSLRVAPFDSDTALPEGLSARNADDRILATAYRVRETSGAERDVMLVTNDLNMLLKAQTLGITVSRHGDGTEGGFGRRFIIRPFQRYRVPLTILAVALAVLVGVILIAVYTQPKLGGAPAQLPAEFKSLLTSGQQTALDALTALQSNPNDTESLLKMANFYFDANATAKETDAASAFSYAQQGIRYFERYLRLSPQDNDARSDFATLLFSTGHTDRAIQEVSTVLKSDRNHVNANFNLGIFYAQGRRDYALAAAQFKKVIKLTVNVPTQHAAYQAAVSNLAQAQKAAAAAGQSTVTTGAQQ
jgi:cytochrome c-type biogenesis protein CcmH/NrfG/rRNA-processing protein FCF1